MRKFVVVSADAAAFAVNSWIVDAVDDQRDEFVEVACESDEAHAGVDAVQFAGIESGGADAVVDVVGLKFDVVVVAVVVVEGDVDVVFA